MAEEWYYARQGDEFGPVSAARLKQLAAAGQLQPTDLVWKIGMDKKVQARAIKGLFGNGSGAATDSRIPPPPSRRANKDDIVPVDPMDEEEARDVDRPRRRPAKKGGIPVWVWIVLGGGLFLVCCVGAPIGVYFGVSGFLGPKKGPTPENLKKLKSGMTLKEVEDIIGPGQVLDEKQFGVKTVKIVKWQGEVGTIDLSFTDDKLNVAPGDFFDPKDRKDLFK